jgi:hypothetical protein
MQQDGQNGKFTSVSVKAPDPIWSAGHPRVQQLLQRRQPRHRHARGGRQVSRHAANGEDAGGDPAWDESFDIGSDKLIGVNDADYKSPFALTARLNKLTVTVGPADIRRLETAMQEKAKAD